MALVEGKRMGITFREGNFLGEGSTRIDSLTLSPSLRASFVRTQNAGRRMER